MIQINPFSSVWRQVICEAISIANYRNFMSSTQPPHDPYDRPKHPEPSEHDHLIDAESGLAESADAKRSTDFGDVDVDDSESDVYEQLARLDDIELDELIDLKADIADMHPRLPVSLVDFFEGLAQLATMGVVEVTEIAEAIHREILLRPLGRLNERNLKKWQRGITGRVYGTVRNITMLVGNNMALGVRIYHTLRRQKDVPPLPQKIKRLVNVINGVMGDHLVSHQNPLAISMALHDAAGLRQQGELSGRVIVLCHGLCMSHLSWQVTEGTSLGAGISHQLPEATVLYLDYNTGQRISKSGRNFSKVLQDLVDNNPNISQIDLVGHSMGGLVSRSALFYGKLQGCDWIQRVGNLITLGSPHHGASLERIGYFVQDMIAKLPFAGALAKLGDLRSAGIIDLRHGSIRDADWQSLEGRNVLPRAFHHPARLPLDINSYFIAATLVEDHYYSKATALLGDGLVTIESALGEHVGEHGLFVPDGHKAIFYGVSHYNLLYNERVHQQVIMWLLDNGKSNWAQNDYVLASRIHSYPDNFEVLL